MSDVLLEKRDTGVALITLNRPESLNALGGSIVPEFHAAVVDCLADAAVRCIAVTGAGRGFCAGGDIRGMQRSVENEAAAPQPEQTVEEAILGFHGFHNAIVVPLYNSRKPTVALVNGPAAGGGMGFALAFDFRICSDRARFVSAFANIAQSGDCGISYGLERLVGRARAFEILMLSEAIGAEQALRLGLAHRVYPHDEFLDRGLEFCARLAAGPTATFARMKENVTFAETHTYVEALEREAYHWKMSQLGHDHRQAIAAFLAKQPPAFTGR